MTDQEKNETNEEVQEGDIKAIRVMEQGLKKLFPQKDKEILTYGTTCFMFGVLTFNQVALLMELRDDGHGWLQFLIMAAVLALLYTVIRSARERIRGIDSDLNKSTAFVVWKSKNKIDLDAVKSFLEEGRRDPEHKEPGA